MESATVTSKLAKAVAQLTKTQRLWIGWTLGLTGITLISRVCRDMYPGIAIASITAALIILALACYAHLLKVLHTTHNMRVWFPLLLAGVLLNQIVVLANGGFMPAAIAPQGIYIPMAGARLPFLGDWILGFMSPGDILSFAAFITLVATIVLRRRGKGTSS